jgi:hypothetical protein
MFKAKFLGRIKGNCDSDSATAIRKRRAWGPLEKPPYAAAAVAIPMMPHHTAAVVAP